MSDLKPVRGTHDILPEEHRRHRHVGDTASAIAALYGYEEISTPIFESTDVFRRTLGETSDVVTKEMYSFEDKSGDSVTLRPEYTAGVARAFISGDFSKVGIGAFWVPVAEPYFQIGVILARVPDPRGGQPGLSRSETDPVMHRALPRITECYDKALKTRDPIR